VVGGDATAPGDLVGDVIVELVEGKERPLAAASNSQKWGSSTFSFSDLRVRFSVLATSSSILSAVEGSTTSSLPSKFLVSNEAEAATGMVFRGGNRMGGEPDLLPGIEAVPAPPPIVKGVLNPECGWDWYGCVWEGLYACGC